MLVPRLATRLCHAVLFVSMVLSIVVDGALAHHGWTWTEDQPFELTGTIEEIYIGHPHVTLKVRAQDGIWHVDLAPLAATTRAGFDEASARVGDSIRCIGYRGRDHGERTMKAARVVVNDTNYDVYPGRIPDL